MRIISVEPTPSPHSMKLTLDEALPRGVMKTYSPDNREHVPEIFRKLLAIPEVKSIFHTADFISIERYPRGSWQDILAQAGEILGSKDGEAALSFSAGEEMDGFGEVHIYMQVFLDIPMQVRAIVNGETIRHSLPERFTQAAMEVGKAFPTLLKERKLVDKGIRYGDPEEILDQVAQEVDAAYDQAWLTEAVQHALNRKGDDAIAENMPVREMPAEEIEKVMDLPEWKDRYAAFQKLKADDKSLPLIAKALQDEHMSIRRLAVVYLGDIGGNNALPYLYQALVDPSVAVRRTAGDTLSDLGNPAAIPEMIRALSDPNKLVRWRAARYLYEVGDESALPALREAAEDSEFEVGMQARIALERIEGGHEAEGTVWQQMMNRNK